MKDQHKEDETDWGGFETGRMSLIMKPRQPNQRQQGKVIGFFFFFSAGCSFLMWQILDVLFLYNVYRPEIGLTTVKILSDACRTLKQLYSFFFKLKVGHYFVMWKKFFNVLSPVMESFSIVCNFALGFLQPITKLLALIARISVVSRRIRQFSSNKALRTHCARTAISQLTVTSCWTYRSI